MQKSDSGKRPQRKAINNSNKKTANYGTNYTAMSMKKHFTNKLLNEKTQHNNNDLHRGKKTPENIEPKKKKNCFAPVVFCFGNLFCE